MTISTKRSAFLFLVGVLTIPAAVIHGRLTHRWGNDTTMEQHAGRIGAISKRVNEWRIVEEPPPLANSVQVELGVRAHINRVYENDTGKRVTVLVMIGEAGPLVRHPVEICYGNRAKRLVSTSALTFDRNSAPQNFKVRRYEPKSAFEDEFYVAYGFCSDGNWDVPASPRLAYGGEPVLYKMQILTNADSTPPNQFPEHLAEFVEQFSGMVWTANEPL